MSAIMTGMRGEAFILYVADLAVSRRFYEGLLGLRPRLDAGSYVEYEFGGAGLGLMPRAAVPGFLGTSGGRPWSDTAPRAEVYLLCDEPGPVLERLAAAGAALESPYAPRPWGDEAAYCFDPDGHVVAIAKRTPRFYELNPR